MIKRLNTHCIVILSFFHSEICVFVHLCKATVTVRKCDHFLTISGKELTFSDDIEGSNLRSVGLFPYLCRQFMENRPNIASVVLTLFMTGLLLVSGIISPVTNQLRAENATEQSSTQTEDQEESQLPEASVSEWQAVATSNAVRFVPLSIATDHLPFFLLKAHRFLEILLGQNLMEKPIVFLFLLEFNQTVFQYIISPNAP